MIAYVCRNCGEVWESSAPTVAAINERDGSSCCNSEALPFPHPDDDE